MAELPPGWKNIPVCEMLEDEHIKEIIKIWNAETDPEVARRKLLAYFSTEAVSKHLASKQVVPSFLSYALYAKFTGII